MDAEDVTDDAAEKDRLSGGHASKAGEGETDGEGEESLVRGGELEALLSVAVDGLRDMIGRSVVVAWLTQSVMLVIT